MFSYNPVSEEQIQELRKYPRLSPGEYPFQVKTATFKPSHAGNPMITLLLSVWDEEGKEFLVYDYLVGTDTMAWKTRHFCESVGLLKEYENNTFNELLCQDKCGRAYIEYVPSTPKPGDGSWPDKNVVSDYLKNEKSEPHKADFDNSLDIPF